MKLYIYYNHYTLYIKIISRLCMFSNTCPSINCQNVKLRIYIYDNTKLYLFIYIYIYIYYCTLFNNPNSHRTVKHWQRCWLKRVIKMISHMLFRRRPKKTAKLRVTGLCARNSLVTGEITAQRANNADNVSIWWLHHELLSRKRDHLMV